MFLSPPPPAGRSGRWRMAPLALAIVLSLVALHGHAHGQAGSRSYNLELVGQSDLGKRALHAAVWGHRTFAYVGTASGRGPGGAEQCGGAGVTIVDIADPARPAVVGSLAERPGTSAEDVQVLAVDGPAFRGDLLATGIQRCSGGATGGLSLWDVSDPHRPAELGFFEVGAGPSGVHEFSMFLRDGLTIGLLAVPFSESLDAQRQGDLRIVDLSNPRAPVQLADWGIGRALGIGARDGLGRDAANYAHSVRASPDGRLAYVSYWDAGVIILDISDLHSPRYLGRTSFDSDDEGNAHSAVPARGGRVLVQADEDTQTRGEALMIEGESPLGAVDAAYGAFRSVLQTSGPVLGEAVYAGRGCPAPPADAAAGGGEAEADPYLADPVGHVVIVDRGDCTFVDKVLRAQGSGAIGVVIANRDPTVISPEGDASGLSIPAALIGRDSADRVKAALGRGEALTVRFGIEQVRYDDWGSLRFWDVADPANPVQVATFATEHARTDRQAGPPADGWYTVHQPVVLGDRLYASWYSDGIRVLDIADPTRPREVGFFVPEASAASAARPAPFVWGVYVRGDLILASDHHSGLYILRDLSR
jgi:hypothetical protein